MKSMEIWPVAEWAPHFQAAREDQLFPLDWSFVGYQTEEAT